MLPLNSPQPVLNSGLSLRHAVKRPALIGAAIGIAFAATGCAPETAQYAPPLLFDGDPAAVAETIPAPSDSVSVTSVDNAADWLNRTYIYRGGRDPKTGLARTQL